MFFNLAATLISALALSQTILALPTKRGNAGSFSPNFNWSNNYSPNYNYNNGYSLNNYNGDSNMGNFDGFYGSSNYDGSHNKVVIIKKKVEVCHPQKVEIIQQRMAVIHEMVKRIITEQICDVETQKIILHQYSSMTDSFSGDLSRQSGRDVGYDSNISGYYNQIVNDDGSLSTDDLGFCGQEVGSNYVTYGGDNWNSQSSPNSVSNAFNAGIAALKSSHRQ